MLTIDCCRESERERKREGERNGERERVEAWKIMNDEREVLIN